MGKVQDRRLRPASAQADAVTAAVAGASTATGSLLLQDGLDIHRAGRTRLLYTVTLYWLTSVPR